MTSSRSASLSEAPSSLTPLRAALAEAAARPARSELCVVRVPAPARRAEALLALEPSAEANYWSEPAGYEYVGLGATRVISANGAARFRTVGDGVRAVFASLGGDAAGLRLFGGFAFQPGRAASPAWSAFGEARFVLPRLAYARSGDEAWLALVLHESELADAAARESALDLAARALDALGEPPQSIAPALVPAPREERSESEFLQLVDQVRAAIERGELEKLVLARRVEVTLPEPVSVPQALRRLGAIAPECVRFAFRVTGTTFLGATPERLVSKQGRAFETDALAGSMNVGDLPAGRLMESVKDRAEQAIVLRELLHSLSPIASELEHSPVPEIHRLRHVVHLRTRISGLLREPLHVLELVERLHPTPAVGGVPSARALSWIAEHEPDERGWYAGPIGWVDAQGDGAFAVALRSGLLEKERASLYAGAGIVQGSDARSELNETRWKLQALLGALGVSP
ncbi:MAG TPA: isochorismate synthase [Polyangiaceae bacterium]|nr:isochorismate synthase [Polyangiaceae bacterium]